MFDLSDPRHEYHDQCYHLTEEYKAEQAARKVAREYSNEMKIENPIKIDAETEAWLDSIFGKVK